MTEVNAAVDNTQTDIYSGLLFAQQSISACVLCALCQYQPTTADCTQYRPVALSGDRGGLLLLLLFLLINYTLHRAVLTFELFADAFFMIEPELQTYTQQ